MMSGTYERIKARADDNYRVMRAQLLLSTERMPLPLPPFNLIWWPVFFVAHWIAKCYSRAREVRSRPETIVDRIWEKLNRGIWAKLCNEELYPSTWMA